MLIKNTGKLAGKTIFITGASRGIGKAIALKAAKDGANIVIAAKTTQVHPTLPGTIYTACEEIERAGGRCLPCVVDIRREDQVRKAVDDAVRTYGAIDIVVNNASAISIASTRETSMKKFDLMNQINGRGTFMVSKYCIPHLMKSDYPHILNIAPPINKIMTFLQEQHITAYALAKGNMSFCVVGMSEELRKYGIAVNALWPRKSVYTSAVIMLSGKEAFNRAYKTEIMSDAAYALLSRDPKSYTGNLLYDDEILNEEGISDLNPYLCVPANSDDKTSNFSNTGSISQVFDSLKGVLNSDLVEKTKALYAFEVKGESGDASQWFINLKEGEGGCGPVQGDMKADATFKMSEDIFVKMFKGEIQPTSAFMSEKLKISGDMGKAMKLEKLMGQMKSKL